MYQCQTDPELNTTKIPVPTLSVTNTVLRDLYPFTNSFTQFIFLPSSRLDFSKNGGHFEICKCECVCVFVTIYVCTHVFECVQVCSLIYTTYFVCNAKYVPTEFWVRSMMSFEMGTDIAVEWVVLLLLADYWNWYFCPQDSVKNTCYLICAS